MDEQLWYLYQGNEQVGPLSTGELKYRIRHGEISPDDFVWTEEWETWLQVGQTYVRRCVPLPPDPQTETQEPAAGRPPKNHRLPRLAATVVSVLAVIVLLWFVFARYRSFG